MTIPMGLVIVPFLAAFLLFTAMYYIDNTERRIVNRSFPLALVAMGAMFFEAIASAAGYHIGRLNVVLFPLGLAWLALGIVMWRLAPPKRR